MRHVFCALAVLAGVAAVAADDEKYTSKEGKFAIRFPAGAEVTTDTKKIPGTQATASFTTAEAGGVTYVAGYTDLPVGKVAVKTLLDASQQGSVKQIGGKLESSKEITVGKNKYPGREFVLEKDGNKLRYRLVLVGNRMYTLGVTGGKDFATTDDATKYLDSFEVTK